MSTKFELDIITNLISDGEYTRKVIPHLEVEYFKEYSYQKLFELISKHYEEYKRNITYKELDTEVSGLVGSVHDDKIAEMHEVVKSLVQVDPVGHDWMIDKTEEFCKKRSMYNAVSQAVRILNHEDKKYTEDAIPDLMRSALAVGFDSRIGHDYFKNVDERYEFYHTDVERLKFRLDGFNKITAGGAPRKSLIIPLAGCVHPKTKIKVRLRKKI